MSFLLPRESAVYMYTLQDWRNFYTEDIVNYNLNLELGTYAQSNIRQLVLNAAEKKEIGSKELTQLSKLGKYVEEMANSERQYTPLHIEPIDVMAIKKAEELSHNFQDAFNVNKKSVKDTDVHTKIFKD